MRRPAFLFGPYLLRGGVDPVLAASGSFAVALAALALYGVGTSTGNITYNTVLQRLAGIGIGGVVADQLGIRTVYGLGVVLLITAGLLGLARLHQPARGSARHGDLLLDTVPRVDNDGPPDQPIAR